MLLVLLTNFLGVLAAWSGWKYIQNREKEYYIWLLILQTGMLGVFCSLDFFLFYVFWEVMLVPMYFLIGIWGGANKLYAAIKFFLYTLAGSVLMLIGILVLYFRTPVDAAGVHTFDLDAILKLALDPKPSSGGSSPPSSWASPSRCPCSPSTRGSPTPTWRRPRRAP